MAESSRFVDVNGRRMMASSPYAAKKARRLVMPPHDLLRSIRPIHSRIGNVPGPELTYPQPEFTVSVSIHGLADMTRWFLDSVIKTSPPRTEILLWDNASDEATRDAVRSFGDRVRPIFSDEDFGFGEGQRRNLVRATAPYFAVVNNDVELQPGWLEQMRESLLTFPDVGIVGTLNTACRLDSNGLGSPCSPEYADYVEASCMMMRTPQARRFGLFDPLFEYAYCEDSDLSLRLRKRGWGMAFTPMYLNHRRAQTMALIEREGRVNLNEVKQKNYQRLRDRWGTYLATRSFRRRVAIVRSDAKGDVLMLTPVLRAMREREPWTELFVRTNVPGVLELSPFVDHLAGAFINPDFDQLIDLDLSYEREPTAPVVDVYARACGIDEPFDRLMDFKPSSIHRMEAADCTRGIKQLAVLHPGQGTWPGRSWPHERWNEVGARLAADGWIVAVVGDPSVQRVKGESIDWRGLSESRSGALIERAKLFIGVDAFPMHLAQAALVPTVGLFGSIDPKLRLLDLPFVRGATANGVECLGCHHTRPGPLTHGVCHRDRIYCMDELTVDDVMRVAAEVLEAKKMFLETSKIRDRVLKYCSGSGIDIGCGRDKITSNAIGFDDDSWPEVDMVGDASGPMPFGNDHFDYVYSSHALEDISDTEATLREWVRILRPDGHLILHVPNPDHYKGFNAEHVHAGWRPEELAILVGNSGCKVIEAYSDVGDDRYSTVIVGVKR